MGTIYLAGIVCLIFILFMVVKAKINRHKLIAKQSAGLSYIKKIRNIILFTQQHRGLSSAWLNGDTSVKAKLDELKAGVKTQRDFLQMTPIEQTERWQSFIDHWQRLTQNAHISVDNSFEQHTAMIKNLIYLVEDTAENYHLTMDHITELPKVGYVWRELVLASEGVGQSRAIGVGVATQKMCSSVNKIKLNFLIQNMEISTKHMLGELSCLDQEQREHGQLTQGAIHKVNELINTIKNELVSPTKVSINNTDYFELASNTIEAINAVFDHQIRQLEFVINNKK